MHECRIYTNYPERGGRLKRIVSPDECRDLFNKNVKGYADLSRKIKSHVCQFPGCDIEFKSTAIGVKYCVDHRAKPVEQYKYL